MRTLGRKYGRCVELSSSYSLDADTTIAALTGGEIWAMAALGVRSTCQPVQVRVMTHLSR